MKLPFTARFLVFYGCRFPHHRGKWWVHNKLRQWLAPQINTSLEVTRGELRWVLNPSDYLEAKLFWMDGLDYWELWHISKNLRRDSVICDIGANFGYYSLKLAANLNGALIHAFEPNPPTYRRLVKNIALNGLERRVFAHQLAVGEAGGEATLIDDHPENSGGAYLGIRPNGIQVAVVSLDQFFESQQLKRLDFIKIDVEGNEERVLNGAARTIEQYRPVILIEIFPFSLTRAGSSAETIVSMLRRWNYVPYSITRRSLKPLITMPSDLMNALCFPAERLPADGLTTTPLRVGWDGWNRRQW